MAKSGWDADGKLKESWIQDCSVEVLRSMVKSVCSITQETGGTFTDARDVRILSCVRKTQENTISRRECAEFLKRRQVTLTGKPKA